MKEIKKNIRKSQVLELIDTLSKKNYIPIYADNIVEARNLVLKLIPQGSSIALGGSVTINELNLIESFRSNNYRLFE